MNYNDVKIDVTLSSTKIEATINSGARGRSAYQVWLDNGHEGTETDFLNWLKSDSYIHVQIDLSKDWIIPHGLGKYPSVTVIDDGDNVVYGDIKYITNNELMVSFNGAFSGKAYLN